MTGHTNNGRYAVGIASIDDLHVECEAALARLDDAVVSGGDAIVELAALHDHLVRHFEHEERLLMRSSAPTCACHMREHASVLEVMVEVRRRYEQGEREPASRLAEAMHEWLDVHAHGMDAVLAQELLKPDQPGGADSREIDGSLGAA